MVNLALITGATSGLGLALARILAKEKIPLLLTGRNREVLEQVQEELSFFSTVSIIDADLSQESHKLSLLKAISDQAPDLVINSAGIGLYGQVLDYSIEEQMHILHLNVDVLTEITIESARVLAKLKRPGLIMNISSAAGFIHYPSFAVYSASKAYVTHFSLSLDAELKAQGIRVLVCCPGQIQTAFRERASLGRDKTKADARTMSVEKAAQLIWRQIQKKKPIQIIDFKYRVLVFLARYIVPARLLQKRLEKELQERISHRL